MANILDLSKEGQKRFFAQLKPLMDVLESEGVDQFDSFIDCMKTNDLISITISRTKRPNRKGEN